MIMEEVADQLAAAAGTVGGLHVFPRPVGAITAPALVVGLPADVQFDQTYGRGADRVQLTVFVLAGRANDRAAGNQLLRYLDGAGATSIKAAIESATYTALDHVRVTAAAVGAVTHNGVDYLGATFECDIYGRGTA